MARRYDRRDFMGLSGAGMAGLLAAPWAVRRALAAVDQGPDLVVTNAKVYTVGPAMPRAEAFAVKAGRFVAVGSTEDGKALAGNRTRAVRRSQMPLGPGI